MPGLRQQRHVHRAAQLQPDDEDEIGPMERLRHPRLPAARDRSRHLRQLQEHLSNRAQEAAFRHRADRQIVSQRDHPGQLHLSRTRVRTGRTRVPSFPTTATTWRPSRSGSLRRKHWYARLRHRAPSGCASTSSKQPERPHYAKAGTDVEYLFPWGWGELESIAHRGTYDLDEHMSESGKICSFFDEASKTHYTPFLIESSAGMDRTVLHLHDRSVRTRAQRRSQRKR